jgi:alanine racemase
MSQPSIKNCGLLRIDGAAIKENYRRLQTITGDVPIAAVVKADAYGLGAAFVAPMLAAAGCDFFYVAHMAEAVALRQILPQVKIAVLHGIAPADQAHALRDDLWPVLIDLPAIQAWSELAKRMGRRLPVIIHLDTGMNRLGLSLEECKRLSQTPPMLEKLDVRFWLSHLACADETEHPQNRAQLEKLCAWLSFLPHAPVSFANSSGIFLSADYHFQQARPGCALYGINPTPQLPNPMLPVVSLQAPVLQIRESAAGETVGYGAGFQCQRATRLAVLPVGYADGLRRCLGQHGAVWFGDHQAPIVGRVSMDLLTVDVTDVPAVLCAIGMLAEIIGPHQDVDQVAALTGTIGYEILTSLGKRYQRFYHGLEA